MKKQKENNHHKKTMNTNIMKGRITMAKIRERKDKRIYTRKCKRCNNIYKTWHKFSKICPKCRMWKI